MIHNAQRNALPRLIGTGMLHGVTLPGLVYITTTLLPGDECRGRNSLSELSCISFLRPTNYVRTYISAVSSGEHLANVLGAKAKDMHYCKSPADDVPVVGARRQPFVSEIGFACLLLQEAHPTASARSVFVSFTLWPARAVSRFLPSSHKTSHCHYCHYRQRACQCGRP